MTGSYLRSIPLGPIGRQQVDVAAIRLVGGLLKGLPELAGVVNLEAGPCRSQNVGDEHGKDVWDRLVDERNDRHSHHPDLEGHKGDVFTLGVVNPTQA
jgi:hypothetical protein